MWVKIILLIIYIAILFVIARLLEVLAWYDAGFLTHRLLDPMTLSVKKLKELLEQRGVSYEGVIEKQQLTELVEATGPVIEDEMQEAADEEVSPVTNFTCGAHFYEQVEDTKDSVWLLQVVTGSHDSSFLENSSWKAIRKKVVKFGGRAGIMDCSLDWKLCTKKGWYSPQMVLALPENFKTKANVVMHVYTGPTKPLLMFKWMKEKLNRRIAKISDFEEFNKDWISFKHNEFEIRAVLFTELASLPLAFSALSVKFPGRVRFGTVDTRTREGRHILEKLQSKSPAYVVIVPGKTLLYGSRPGELLTFSAMESFLKSLYPEVNDFFILSLLITNVLGWFEFFLAQGSIFRRMARLLWCVVKYNIIVIIIWQPLLALFQLSSFQVLLEWGLHGLRFLNGSNIGHVVRKDLFFYSNNQLLLVGVFLLYSLSISILEYKRKGGVDEMANWFDFSQLRNLNPLLNPSFQIVHPGGLYAMYMLESSDLLLGHFPDMITEMQPIVSTEYIKYLRRWKYGLVPLVEEKTDVIGDLTNIGPDTEFSGQNVFSADSGYSSAGNPFIQNMMDGNYRCDCARRSTVQVPNETTLIENFESTCSMRRDQLVCLNSDSENDCSSVIPTQAAATTPVPEGFLEATQCVICLDIFLVGAVLCGLPCGHCFHEQCILPWLYRANHVCPVCRWPSYKHRGASSPDHSNSD